MKAKRTSGSSIKISSKLLPGPSSGGKSKSGASVRDVQSVRSGRTGADNMSVLSGLHGATQLMEHQTKSIIESLQSQLNETMKKLKNSELEINELKSSLATREQEIARAGKLVATESTSTSKTATLSLSVNPAVTEIANKRIIDQLNSQVDFLNDQLAFREAQLSAIHHRINEVDDMRAELDAKTLSVEKMKDENSRLTNRIQKLEQKVNYLRLVSYRFSILMFVINLRVDADHGHTAHS